MKNKRHYLEELENLQREIRDELRDKNTKLENGRNLPDLFNFNKTEMRIDPKYIREKLIPDWYEKDKNQNRDYSVEDYNNRSEESN